MSRALPHLPSTYLITYYKHSIKIEEVVRVEMSDFLETGYLPGELHRRIEISDLIIIMLSDKD